MIQHASIPFYAKRFVAGTRWEETLPTILELNKNAISVTVDVLGENIKDISQAEHYTEEYLMVLEQIQEKKLNASVSLKLTNIGLDISEEECLNNLKKIVTLADSIQSRVCLDMESSKYTERTIRMYEKLASKHNSIEVVLQAYLFRTELDCERVLGANGKMRLCKGAYKETEKHALQNMQSIRNNYCDLLKKILLDGKRICIATHDDKIIQFAKSFIRENHIPKDRYEFQMLYGLRKSTWLELSKEGHNMTVYLPYGTDWKAYFSRRLIERKENILFVVKNFFKH